MVTIGMSYSDALDMDHVERVLFVEMSYNREKELAKKLSSK